MPKMGHLDFLEGGGMTGEECHFSAAYKREYLYLRNASRHISVFRKRQMCEPCEIMGGLCCGVLQSA